MSETSLKPVIDKLENLFSKFNEKFYNGELQKAIITVSPLYKCRTNSSERK